MYVTQDILKQRCPHPLAPHIVMTWWSPANPTDCPLGSGLTRLQHSDSDFPHVLLCSCHLSEDLSLLHTHKHQTVKLTSHQTDSPTLPGLLLHLPLQSFYPFPSVYLLGYLACLDSSKQFTVLSAVLSKPLIVWCAGLLLWFAKRSHSGNLLAKLCSSWLNNWLPNPLPA